MATIINTLEVLLEQPPAQQPPSPAGPPKPPPLPLTPRDLEDVLERQLWSVARVAAH